MTSQQFDRTAAISPAHFARPTSQQIPGKAIFLPTSYRQKKLKYSHLNSPLVFFASKSFPEKPLFFLTKKFFTKNPASIVLKIPPRVP